MHKHFNKFTVEWKKIELKEKSCEKWLTTNTFTLIAEMSQNRDNMKIWPLKH